jgi:hypothetical protein
MNAAKPTFPFHPEILSSNCALSQYYRGAKGNVSFFSMEEEVLELRRESGPNSVR